MARSVPQHEFKRRGRMIVRLAPPASRSRDAWPITIRDPVMKWLHRGLLFPARPDGTHGAFALTVAGNVYVFGPSWDSFLDSAIPEPRIGQVEQLLKVPVAELPMEALDALFGEGMSQAARLLEASPKFHVDLLPLIASTQDPVKRKYRAQAFAQFPLLVEWFSGHEEIDIARSQRYADLVDGGASLLRELPQMFGCKPWVIRHLRGVHPDEVYPYLPFGMDQLVRNMDWLTPERAPREPDFDHLSNIAELKLHANHPWIVEAMQRTVLRQGWGAFAAHAAAIPHLLDYANFVERLAAGLTLKPDRASEAIDEALGRPTFGQLVELSDRWHDAENFVRQLLRGDVPTEPGTWRPLLERPLSVWPFELHCLNTRHALAEEGLEQEHCVGSYAYRCEAQASHILSLRLEGARVATVELGVTRAADGANKLRIRQVSGRKNANPGDEARRAVQDAVRIIEGRGLSDFPADVPDPRGGGLGPPGRREVGTITLLFERSLGLPGARARFRRALVRNEQHPALWHYAIARFQPAANQQLAPHTLMTRRND